MTLDRGTLAKIDRRVFAELEHRVATQAVKLPLSDAEWSTWRRYCQAIGLTMGEAVAGLIIHELQTVVDGHTGAGVPVFAGRLEEELAARESQVTARERDLAETAERNRERMRRLGTWERELQARDRRIDMASNQVSGATAAGRKVGRNERCPCSSGLKYKLCHGHPDSVRGPG